MDCDPFGRRMVNITKLHPKSECSDLKLSVEFIEPKLLLVHGYLLKGVEASIMKTTTPCNVKYDEEADAKTLKKCKTWAMCIRPSWIKTQVSKVLLCENKATILVIVATTPRDISLIIDDSASAFDLVALFGQKGGLQSFLDYIKDKDADIVSTGLASSLDTIDELELFTGRGTIEFIIEKGDGSTFLQLLANPKVRSSFRELCKTGKDVFAIVTQHGETLIHVCNTDWLYVNYYTRPGLMLEVFEYPRLPVKRTTFQLSCGEYCQFKKYLRLYGAEAKWWERHLAEM
ncbi:hypothetical protein IFM89_033302 [Coptis chinensis]|uniref:Uncharacterized protein n=1 Tax=Coptis chinensis TaxID=261450 RepID=A0A835LNG2_9MAGN|nr:hypothetical protein IFM89_033302 [Coptis chinensis]